MFSKFVAVDYACYNNITIKMQFSRTTPPMARKNAPAAA
jgi:hypothetical protein